MKNFALMLLLCLSTTSRIAQAQDLRDPLLDQGQSLLQTGTGGPEFAKHVDTLHQAQPLSEMELSYLRDLREKLPPGLRAEVCPTGDELACGKSLPERAFGSMFAPHPTKWQAAPSGVPPQPSKPSWKSSWWIPVVAGGLLLSYGFRGKEIQVSAP